MSEITKIDNVDVRMYSIGTGDCFLLRFKSGKKLQCTMLIDCGCINVKSPHHFEHIISSLKSETKNNEDKSVIDILIVTHEHMDHINGFKERKNDFADFYIGEVWFAWTEDESDKFANDLRENHSKLKLAVSSATRKLNGLMTNNTYENTYADEYYKDQMLGAKKTFINSLKGLDDLNLELVVSRTGKQLGMATLFKELNIIKDDTPVYYLNPGELYDLIDNLPGVRVFVLGPPRDRKMLNITERHGQQYKNREHGSNKDLALADVMSGTNNAAYLPFDNKFELSQSNPIKDKYDDEQWRKIDHDWLYSAGGLALRYQRSINNTSLALAFQFEESKRVLLFPGDAEFGNWQSWHDWEWTISNDGEIIDADVLLANTVFYKVSHHCSYNGTPTELGLEKMTHDDLCAMIPLNFKKILPNWLRTMPNDLLCEELIYKCNGKVYFPVGQKEVLMNNIKTNRVNIKKQNEDVVNEINDQFNGQGYVECVVYG